MLAEVPSPRGFGARRNGGIHCPRAFRRLVSDPPYLVGYCRWDGRSGRMTPPDNHTHDFTSHPFVKIVDGHQAAALPERDLDLADVGGKASAAKRAPRWPDSTTSALRPCHASSLLIGNT